MGRANALLELAVNNEDLDKTIGLKMKINRRNADARAIFDKADLVKIFNSDQYLNDNFKKPYQFWIPIVALFTGARQNEIAQLHLSDFQQHDGVWCININDDTEDKRIKNLASHRLVPLHPFLVEDLGIIQRVKYLQTQKKTLFFHDLPLGRDGYGKNVSRWFNEGYKQSCGIPGRSKKSSIVSTIPTSAFVLSQNINQPKTVLLYKKRGAIPIILKTFCCKGAF